MIKRSASSLGVLSSKNGLQPSRGFVIIGHRGADGCTSHLSGGDGGDVPEGLAPENSLASLLKDSFTRDGNEFDVYNSQDGIPVICHDDDLKLNIAGVDRSQGDCGDISRLAVCDLFEFDVGQGRPIPPLKRAMERLADLNEARRREGLNNIIFDIELKGPGTAQTVHTVVQSMVSAKKINPKDVFYCSPHMDELTALRHLNPSAQITATVYTSEFFGEENVSDNFMVPMNLTYKPGLFDILDSSFAGFCAIDCALWDITDELIEYAKRRHIGIHATAAKFDKFNVVIIDYLLEISEALGVDRHGRSRLFFKTDCPAKVKEMMDARLAERASLSQAPSSIVTKVSVEGFLQQDRDIAAATMAQSEEEPKYQIVKGRLSRPDQPLKDMSIVIKRVSPLGFPKSKGEQAAEFTGRSLLIRPKRGSGVEHLPGVSKRRKQSPAEAASPFHLSLPSTVNLVDVMKSTYDLYGITTNEENQGAKKSESNVEDPMITPERTADCSPSLSQEQRGDRVSRDLSVCYQPGDSAPIGLLPGQGDPPFLAQSALMLPPAGHLLQYDVRTVPGCDMGRGCNIRSSERT